MEKEMAAHSSVLAWRIPGMAEPGGLPSMASHRVGHDWSDLAAAAAAAWCLSQPALLEPRSHPLWAVLSPKCRSFLCKMKLIHLLNHAAVRTKVGVSCEPAKRDCYLVSPQEKLPSNHAVSRNRKCRAPGLCVPGDRPSMCSQVSKEMAFKIRSGGT